MRIDLLDALAHLPQLSTVQTEEATYCELQENRSRQVGELDEGVVSWHHCDHGLSLQATPQADLHQDVLSARFALTLTDLV